MKEIYLFSILWRRCNKKIIKLRRERDGSCEISLLSSGNISGSCPRSVFSKIIRYRAARRTFCPFESEREKTMTTATFLRRRRRRGGRIIKEGGIILNQRHRARESTGCTLCAVSLRVFPSVVVQEKSHSARWRRKIGLTIWIFWMKLLELSFYTESQVEERPNMMIKKYATLIWL